MERSFRTTRERDEQRQLSPFQYKLAYNNGVRARQAGVQRVDCIYVEVRGPTRWGDAWRAGWDNQDEEIHA